MTAPITERLSTTFRYTLTQLDYSGDLTDNFLALPPCGQGIAVDALGDLADGHLQHAGDAQLPHGGIFSLRQRSRNMPVSAAPRLLQAERQGEDLLHAERRGRCDRLAGRLGRPYVQHGGADGSLRPVPVSNSDVRGFERMGIGPQQLAIWRCHRRTTYFTASAEATFPLPGVSRDAGFRGAILRRCGTLYGNDVAVTRQTAWSARMPRCAPRSVSALIWASPLARCASTTPFRS